MSRTRLSQQNKDVHAAFPAQGILQRKCACGNRTISGGECAECKKKKNSIQRKLAIGASDDVLEREADRVADQVMEMSANSRIGSVSPRIQRISSRSRHSPETVPVSVDRVLSGSGRPLEPTFRQDMERRFGYDFSHVRVHSGVAAERSVRDVNANAYTVRNNIVFGSGQYEPSTHEGRRLIAHELTHVIQQEGFKKNRKNKHSIQSSGFNSEQHFNNIKVHNNSVSTEANLQRQINNETSSGEKVRNRCVRGLGCPAITHCDHKPCAVVNCGTGKCPYCPPGFENLVIRAWCVYSCLPTGSAFILITRGFDIHIGPICLD